MHDRFINICSLFKKETFRKHVKQVIYRVGTSISQINSDFLFFCVVISYKMSFISGKISFITKYMNIYTHYTYIFDITMDYFHTCLPICPFGLWTRTHTESCGTDCSVSWTQRTIL